MTATVFRTTRFAFALLPLLAACTSLSPESRLAAGLEDAGLSKHMAQCMAKRMASRLSLAQLRKLQSLGTLRKPQGEAQTVEELVRKLRALGDPEIVAVSGKAAFSCAF